MSYDLAILGDPYDELSDLAIVNDACEGLYKLLQKVIILLLTDRASPFNMGVGTDLPSEVISANISDPVIVQGLFQIGLSKIRETIQSQTPYDAPDDEKLQDFQVTVTSGDTDDSLNAEISVTSVADGTIAVKVPISNLFISQE
jgi:hypothetical protein